MAEVGEVDTAPDIKRRPGSIFDQVRWAGYPQEDERQPFVLGLRGPRVVASANGGKEIIREGKLNGPFDFIRENHESARGF